MTSLAAVLEAWLDAARSSLVALTPFVDAAEVTGLAARDDVTVMGLAEPGPIPDDVDLVVLVARDLLDLRHCLGVLKRLPSTSHVGCLLLQAGEPPSFVADAVWPRVLRMSAETEPVPSTFVQFAGRVRAGAVFAAMARQVTRGGLAFSSWPRVGALVAQPHRWPAGDNAALVDDADGLVDLTRFFPADVIVVDERSDLPAEFSGLDGATVHDVLGRMPVIAAVGPELSWEDVAQLGPTDLAAQLGAAGPLSLGGLDQLSLTPRSFRRSHRRPVAELRAHRDPDRLLAAAGRRELELDVRHGLAEADLTALRPYAGVHVGWEGARGPQAYCRTVVALAMGGVPLTCDSVPQWARALLHPELVDALQGTDGLDDVGTREVRSIRQRRAAHRQHSATAWRRRLAATYGTQLPQLAAVSVLLPTRRPEQLGFALRQVARQRRDGFALELVLIAHGFEPDPAALELFEASGIPLRLVRAGGDRPFGGVLNDGAAVAGGDVLLKMDDDDWYGRDFVSDLLLARDYSAAEVVGCSPEYTFVEPIWQTVRHKEGTEKFSLRAAGGTLLIDRGLFATAGGFRETRRSVDGALLAAIRAAGGAVYRTHGHGYVLRRLGSGHTWDPGMDFFTNPERSWMRWDGFAPSPLLDAAPEDLPQRAP